MPTPRSRTPIRRIAYGLLWTIAVGLALFTGWRWFGPDVSWPVVAALPFTPYVVVAAVVPILLAVWLRAVRVLTLVVVCACALLVLLVPRAVANGDAGAEGVELRVMTVNTLQATDMDTVVEIAADHDIDVLTIQQLTEEHVETLESSTLPDQLSHDLLQPATMGAGTGIYSRYALTEAEDLSTDGYFNNPAAVIDVPRFGDVEFLAVHPSPPLNPERMKHWHHDLRALPDASADGPPRIMAGDFNATLDHRTLRDLIDTGYTDAADATGNGLTGTWPADRALFPKVTIDHVLTSDGITPVGYEVHEVPGTDHRAVTATLVLPKKP